MKPKAPAHAFFAEELLASRLAGVLRIKAMWGSHAIYIGNKIYFMLRHKADPITIRDNGIWIALSGAGTLPEFPALRPIELFRNRGQKGFADWLVLPEDAPTFEEDALRIAALITSSRGIDPRLGKLPK